MSTDFEADVLPIHIAGGEGRVSPPPGVLAEGAPRRAARGRGSDLLFLILSLRSDPPVSAARVEQLARLANQAFFSSAGSVTAALRASASTVNEHLLNGDRGSRELGTTQGSLIAAALRGRDLYIGQCGAGQIVLVRPGSVTRIGSAEARRHALGSNLAVQMRFRHLQLQQGDLLVLTTAEPPLWSDPSLSALSGLGLSQAVDRLVAASGRDLIGLLVRIPRRDDRRQPLAARSSPSAVQPPGAPDEVAAPSMRRRGEQRPVEPSEEPTPAPAGSPRDRRRTSLLHQIQIYLAALYELSLQLTRRVFSALGMLVLRMAPGLADSQHPGSYSPALLAFTAVAIPILVVGIASLVYFRRGRVEQFESYLAQAQASVVAARLKGAPEEARSEWQMAKSWLDLAETYRVTEASSALRSEVRSALDSIDLVIRLDFVPVISGGFGASAKIGDLAASATDLYVLDHGNQVIWHAWATGRGYEIDSQFECPIRSRTSQGIREPVSIAIQQEPGALGVEGVVAVDRNGELQYCASGRSPLQGSLTPPDIGWGRLQAIDVFKDSLYVLDPVTNAVWIYDAADGLFSGSPALYFAEEVPDLESAIDLALAQEELIILHQEGHIDRCRRIVDNAPDGSLRVRVSCEVDPRFTDERTDQPASASIPSAAPLQMVYSPPPEPSLFFLDATSGSIYQYSMRLVYLGVILPAEPIDGTVSTLTEAPPNDLFVATTDQVYYAQLSR